MKRTEAKVANPDIDLIDFQPAKFLAFRDMEVCRKVARIPKEKLCRLPRGTHPQFKARIAPVKDYHFQMALDMLVRIKTRLVLHGPIVPEIPCSILRTAPGDYVVMEPVAENLKIELTA